MQFRVLILFLVFSSLVQAESVENGKKLYAKCIQCHGENGQGIEAEEGPRIGGQYDWYIITQVKAFLSGTRKNPKMLPFIKGLSDKEIADLAAFVSQLTEVN